MLAAQPAAPQQPIDVVNSVESEMRQGDTLIESGVLQRGASEDEEIPSGQPEPVGADPGDTEREAAIAEITEREAELDAELEAFLPETPPTNKTAVAGRWRDSLETVSETEPETKPASEDELGGRRDDESELLEMQKEIKKEAPKKKAQKEQEDDATMAWYNKHQNLKSGVAAGSYKRGKGPSNAPSAAPGLNVK